MILPITPAIPITHKVVITGGLLPISEIIEAASRARGRIGVACETCGFRGMTKKKGTQNARNNQILRHNYFYVF
jgi:DNA-directed RNA polymerase subunit RPC12/RpoP